MSIAIDQHQDRQGIAIDGAFARIEFRSFDLNAYDRFLQVKRLPEKRVSYDWKADSYTVTFPARFADRLGVEKPAVGYSSRDLSPHLFDYQKHFTLKAFEARRWANFWDCGLGKTQAELEFGRLAADATKARFLHVTLNNVVPQIIKEAAKFYGDSLPIMRCNSAAELAAFCEGAGDPAFKTGIVNVDKLDALTPDEAQAIFRQLGGISVDESSLLKTGGGNRKWTLIRGCKGIEFKLSSTATPAPNDSMEYASQAAFLETIRHEGEVLWTFFTRKNGGDWEVKPHAKQAFYEFLSSWSAYLRNPVTYGFADNLASIPDPVWLPTEVAPTHDQMRLASEIFAENGSGMFGDESLGIVPRTKLAQIAHGFMYGKSDSFQGVESFKPGIVADFVRDENAAGRQVIVWTTFDADSDILAPLLPAGSFEVLDGRTPMRDRESIIERTERGETVNLLSKASTLGFGRNLQQFASMSFFGFDDSMERMYQAVRRLYRYGQTQAVRIQVPFVQECEGRIWDNLQWKAARIEDESQIMEACYLKAIEAEGGLLAA